MGVNVRCEVCGRFIRRVEVKYLDSIKEDEICDDCDTKLRKLHANFEKSVEKFKQKLGELNNKSEKEFKLVNSKIKNLKEECDEKLEKMNDLLNQTYKNYIDEMEGLARTTRAELGDKIMRMGRFFK